MKKYQSFLSENFQFLEVKFSICLNRRVFVMQTWQELNPQPPNHQSDKHLTEPSWPLGSKCELFQLYVKNLRCPNIKGIYGILLLLHLNHIWAVPKENVLSRNITKTCLYNFDPLKPHFYVVNHFNTIARRSEWICSIYVIKNIKISKFFIWKFSVLGSKINIFK